MQIQKISYQDLFVFDHCHHWIVYHNHKMSCCHFMTIIKQKQTDTSKTNSQSVNNQMFIYPNILFITTKLFFMSFHECLWQNGLVWRVGRIVLFKKQLWEGNFYKVIKGNWNCLVGVLNDFDISFACRWSCIQKSPIKTTSLSLEKSFRFTENILNLV